MLRLPGPADLVAALGAQAEAFAQLPATLTALNRAVWALTESVGQARETVQRVNRVTAQAEEMLTALEGPILAARARAGAARRGARRRRRSTPSR